MKGIFREDGGPKGARHGGGTVIRIIAELAGKITDVVIIVHGNAGGIGLLERQDIRRDPPDDLQLAVIRPFGEAIITGLDVVGHHHQGGFIRIGRLDFPGHQGAQQGDYEDHRQLA